MVVSFCVSAWSLWFAFCAAWYLDTLPECFDDRLLWLQKRFARNEAILSLHRSQRLRVFTAIITALSDQQLVLESSVLIAALARRDAIDTSRSRKLGKSEWYAFLNSRGAVQWDLIGFSFPLVDGTFSIVRDRETFQASEDLNDMGFGQIVPLVLLLLPILAALQASAGKYALPRCYGISLINRLPR